MSETRLAYGDLELPNYRNSSTAVSIKGKVNSEERVFELVTDEVLRVPPISGLNMLLVSDTGNGKTQWMRDITQRWFGGDVSNGGHINWKMGRTMGQGSSIDDLFLEFSNEEKRYVTREGRIVALVNCVDELNAAAPPIQFDYFDLAEGEREVEGEMRELGKEGYHLFLAAVNLNRINGDFSGVSEINRALLSRSRINVDLDFYHITEEDEAWINSQGKPGLKIAEPRDISEKILAAFKEIESRSSKPNPHIDTYLMILSAGLRSCKKDELGRKRRNWPMECGNCDLYETDDKTVNPCSQIKQSEPRTSQTIKRFAVGLDYFIGLKEDAEVELDPLDLVFEAAKFTAYHGNLNSQELLRRYKGDDQHMMNTILAQIKACVQGIRTYLDHSIEEAMRGNVVTKYIRFQISGKEEITPWDESFAKSLEEKELTYTVHEPFKELEAVGIGTSWVEPHLKAMAERYQENA